jgi:hypothetical protein
MSENPGRSRRRTSKTAKTGGDHPSLVYPVYLYQTQSTSERYTLTFATLLVCIAFLLVICKESIAVMVALACRQMTCRRLLRELQPKTIPMLRERQFKLPILNKSFACCWLDMVRRVAFCMMITSFKTDAFYFIISSSHTTLS